VLSDFIIITVIIAAVLEILTFKLFADALFMIEPKLHINKQTTFIKL